jgi:hypothetical protein
MMMEEECDTESVRAAQVLVNLSCVRGGTAAAPRRGATKLSDVAIHAVEILMTEGELNPLAFTTTPMKRRIYDAVAVLRTLICHRGRGRGSPVVFDGFDKIREVMATIGSYNQSTDMDPQLTRAARGTLQILAAANGEYVSIMDIAKELGRKESIRFSKDVDMERRVYDTLSVFSALGIAEQNSKMCALNMHILSSTPNFCSIALEAMRQRRSTICKKNFN